MFWICFHTEISFNFFKQFLLQALLKKKNKKYRVTSIVTIRIPYTCLQM